MTSPDRQWATYGDLIVALSADIRSRQNYRDARSCVRDRRPVKSRKLPILLGFLLMVGAFMTMATVGFVIAG